MTTFTKSNIITNLDASPVVRGGAVSNWGPGRLVRKMGMIVPGITDATTVVYRMVRVPSNACIQRVAVGFDNIAGGAITTFTGNVGVYFSDSTSDGTSVGNVGSTTAISDSFFAYELAMATFFYVVGTDPSNTIGLFAPVDITFQNSSGNSVTDGYYLPSLSYLPLWKAMNTGSNTGAAGVTTGGASTMTSDPGGYFDICFHATTTTSISTKGSPFNMFVDYMEP